MGRYWDNDTVYSQPTVDELRSKAKASSESAAKKKLKYEPIEPFARRNICMSWWGQAWCRNLEQYADYESRLGRGKRYVKNGTVIDLKIKKGKIEARVQGSRKSPYKVDIRISPLSEEKCGEVIEKCGRRIENMESLVKGEFPDDLRELFTGRNGLFPSPKEISFNCSCPDWALMCKHVAAVMYGIGVRLDENPFYFFELRGIDADRFINVALESKVESMLSNADKMSERIIKEADLTALFGVI